MLREVFHGREMITGQVYLRLSVSRRNRRRLVRQSSAGRSGMEVRLRGSDNDQKSNSRGVGGISAGTGGRGCQEPKDHASENPSRPKRRSKREAEEMLGALVRSRMKAIPDARSNTPWVQPRGHRLS